MAIREDKTKLPNGSFQVDELPLTADTDTTLGVSTSQFALLGQRHVLEDNMRDTLYGAVRTGNSVVVGELTGDHPDVARPDPSGVTTLVTETTQNRNAEDLEQRQRNWATEATSFTGAEGFKPGDTRLLMMLGNPFLSFLADQVMSLPQASTVDEAIARGDYARAAALRNSEVAREKAEGINADGTAHIERQPGQGGAAYADDSGLTPTTTPHFQNGNYYDSYGGHYDSSGYTFKDGSYKDVSGNFYDAKTNTLTAGDTGAVIDIPASIHRTGAQLAREADERVNGSHALTASNTSPVPGHPPSRGAGHDKPPQPGSRYARKTVGEAELREQIQIDLQAGAAITAIGQQVIHGGATTALHAVSAADAQAKVGFIHKTASESDIRAAIAADTARHAEIATTAMAAAPAATVGPSAADATWYSDGKGGYFDNLGGYYDTKGGYWDAKGGYTDAKGGYLDQKGGYTWPDGSYIDAKFNYTDKDGNMTTAQGDFYKARPGTDFKAELQAAATNGSTFAPPALGAGDVPAEWRARVAAERAESGVATGVTEDKSVLAATAPAVTVTSPVITPIVTSTAADASRITPIAIPASASPLSSSILTGVDLTNFQMTTPAPDATSPFSLFSSFRDDFDTPKAGKFVTNFNVPSLLDPAPAAAPATSTAATLPKAAPATVAPKAT